MTNFAKNWGSVVVLSLLLPACNGSGSTEADVCTPGATRLCNGSAACEGAQVCQPDGASYSMCDCGNSTDSSNGTSAGGDTSSGGVSDSGSNGQAAADGTGGASNSTGSGLGGSSGDTGSGGSTTGAAGAPATELVLDWAYAITPGATPQQLLANPESGFHVSGTLNTANFGNGEVEGDWFAVDRAADGSHVQARTLDGRRYLAAKVGARGVFASVHGSESDPGAAGDALDVLHINSHGAGEAYGWTNSYGRFQDPVNVAYYFALAVAADGSVFYASEFRIPYGESTENFSAFFSPEGELSWDSEETPGSAVFLPSGNLLMFGLLDGDRDFGGGVVSGEHYLLEVDASGNHVASWGTDAMFEFQDFDSDIARPTMRPTARYAVIEGRTYASQVPAAIGDDDLVLDADSGWMAIAAGGPDNYHYAGVWPSVESDSGAMLTPAIHITVDDAGHTFACGHFWRTLEAFGESFTAQGTDDSDSDIVVAVLDESGDLLFAHSFGDLGPDTCNDVAIDADGGLLVTGRYATSLDLGSGPLEDEPRTEADGPMMYIARFELVSGL